MIRLNVKQEVEKEEAVAFPLSLSLTFFSLLLLLSILYLVLRITCPGLCCAHHRTRLVYRHLAGVHYISTKVCIA
jgi:hypothetical protein